MGIPAELELLKHTDTVNQLLARYGVKLSIYKNNEFREQLFPFDAIPRIIGAEEFAGLERGLQQKTMEYVNCGGLSVVLTPGRYNSAYFEHSYLAEKTGAKLVSGQDLVVEDNIVYYKNYNGTRERVGAIYRRISGGSSPRTSSISRIWTSWTRTGSGCPGRRTCGLSCSWRRNPWCGTAGSPGSPPGRIPLLSTHLREEVSKTHGYYHGKSVRLPVLAGTLY